MPPSEFNVLDFFKMSFVKFQMCFSFQLFAVKGINPVWKGLPASQSLVPLWASHPLPRQPHFVLDDCKNLSWCAALYRIWLVIPNKASAADAALWQEITITCLSTGHRNLPPGPRKVLLATKQHRDTLIFLPLPFSTPTVNRWLFSWLLCMSV